MPKSSDPEWDAYCAAADLIDNRVKAAIAAAGQESFVSYSAYDTDENDVPIDNLDQVAFEGKVVLIRKKDSWTKNAFRSKVLENPTFLQATVVANEGIIVTGDYHHAFFEGLEKVSEADGVTVCEMCMGS